MSNGFKHKIDEAVHIIEECFDENNRKDNKTFDERLTERIRQTEDETIKQILIQAQGG